MRSSEVFTKWSLCTRVPRFKMLKHATPRSSPDPRTKSLSPESAGKVDFHNGEYSANVNEIERTIKEKRAFESVPESCEELTLSYNERGVDCTDIIVPPPLVKKCVTSCNANNGGFWGEKILNFSGFNAASAGIGPVITQGKAIVRRGLSFNTKKESDSFSVRSVKSEVKMFELTLPPNKLPKSVSAPSIQTNGNDYLNQPSANNVVPSLSGSDNSSSPNQKIIKSTSTKESSNRSSYKIHRLSKNDHPTLKTLLRLPGVYGHIPVPENTPCDTPHVISPDSLSLNSSDSFLSSNSGRVSSRSWDSNTSSNSNQTSDSSNSNCSSTSEPTSTTLKIFAKCLRSDIEYKTVNIGSRVTSRQLINMLLSKTRMRHRDPNLFYLTMEVTVRRWSGMPVRALLVLEDSARPSQLTLCRPSGDLKFVLQMRKGGVIKIHDTVLMPGSQYKSLLVSYRTTCIEAIQLILNCYERQENKNYYALHEVCQSPHYSDRLLQHTYKPLELKAEWPRDRRAEFIFVLRRNMTQALSLRKLSLRTHESGNNRTPEITTLESLVSAKARTVFSRETKIDSYSRTDRITPETLIDCTSTIPMMLTVLKKEARLYSQPNTVQQQKECPINYFQYTGLYKATHQNGQISHNLAIENKENLTRTISEDKTQNNKLLVTSSSKVDSEPKNETISTDVPKKCTGEKKESLISPSECKFQPKPPDDQKCTQNNDNDPNKNKVRTSNERATRAAQTELSCIPLKGISKHRRWNSVETLLDIHILESKPFVKPGQILQNNNTLSEDKPSESKTQEIQNNTLSINENEFSHKVHNTSERSDGKRCSCSKCFYI